MNPTQLIFMNFLLGFLGFFFYSLWDSRTHFNTEKGWIFSKFLNDNYQQWIFNILVILIILVVVEYDKNTTDFFKDTVGINLNNETVNGGFFIIGYMLTPLTKKSNLTTKTTT